MEPPSEKAPRSGATGSLLVAAAIVGIGGTLAYVATGAGRRFGEGLGFSLPGLVVLGIFALATPAHKRTSMRSFVVVLSGIALLHAALLFGMTLQSG